MEEQLTPAERRRFAKFAQAVSLTITENQEFILDEYVQGRVTQIEGHLKLTPVKVGGRTETEMRAMAEELGRDFGLAWLFAPMELCTEGDQLFCFDQSTMFFTEFTLTTPTR